jgi:hypothetical protein
MQGIDAIGSRRPIICLSLRDEVPTSSIIGSEQRFIRERRQTVFQWMLKRKRSWSALWKLADEDRILRALNTAA